MSDKLRDSDVYEVFLGDSRTNILNVTYYSRSKEWYLGGYDNPLNHEESEEEIFRGECEYTWYRVETRKYKKIVIVRDFAFRDIKPVPMYMERHQPVFGSIDRIVSDNAHRKIKKFLIDPKELTESSSTLEREFSNANILILNKTKIKNKGSNNTETHIEKHIIDTEKFNKLYRDFSNSPQCCLFPYEVDELIYGEFYNIFKKIDFYKYADVENVLERNVENTRRKENRKYEEEQYSYVEKEKRTRYRNIEDNYR